MDIGAARAGLRRRNEQGRAFALRMLDIVPGLRRLVEELARVQVIDRAMVIAAQALLALVPLLIVMAAFLPLDLGIFTTDRFANVTGLSSARLAPAQRALDPDTVRTQTGTAGVLLTILSATSFARAVQRTYERVWDIPHIGGVSGARRCLSWLAGWLVFLPLIGLVGSLVGGWVPFGVLTPLAQVVLGALLWWWSARVLLLGRVPWLALLPGAVLTGVGSTIYSAGSGLVMPAYAANSAAQLGVLGLVLTATSWLIGFGFMLVVATVLGRVLAEESRIHEAVVSGVDRLRHRLARHQLDGQHDDHRDREDGQRERTGRVRHDVDQQRRSEDDDA